MKIFRIKMNEAGLQLFIKYMRKAPVEEVEDFLNDVRQQVRAQLPKPKGVPQITLGDPPAAKPLRTNGSASRYAKAPQ